MPHQESGSKNLWKWYVVAGNGVLRILVRMTLNARYCTVPCNQTVTARGSGTVHTGRDRAGPSDGGSGDNYRLLR